MARRFGSVRITNRRETYDGPWRVGGRRVSGASDWKRTASRADGLTRVHAEAALRQLMAASLAPPGDRCTVAEAGAIRTLAAGLRRTYAADAPAGPAVAVAPATTTVCPGDRRSTRAQARVCTGAIDPSDSERERRLRGDT